MSLPSGNSPGSDITVPAQKISLNWRAEEMIFYVSEVILRTGAARQRQFG